MITRGVNPTTGWVWTVVKQELVCIFKTQTEVDTAQYSTAHIVRTTLIIPATFLWVYLSQALIAGLPLARYCPPPARDAKKGGDEQGGAGHVVVGDESRADGKHAMRVTIFKSSGVGVVIWYDCFDVPPYERDLPRSVR